MKIYPCPVCGSTDVDVWAFDEEGPVVYIVQCYTCRARAHAPYRRSELIAIADWNEYAGGEK